MTPDPSTLLGYSTVIFLLLGVHFILSEFSGRRWSRMAWYAAPFFLGAVSGLFSTVQSILPGQWGLRMSSLFMIMAYGAAWQAMRIILGYRTRVLPVLLACIVFFILSALSGRTGLFHVLSTAFRLAALAMLHLLGIWNLRNAEQITTPARRNLQRLLTLYAGFYLLLVALVLWLPAPLGAAPATIWAVATYNFLTVVEVTLFALGMIAIPWEQLAFRQKELILQDPLSGGGNRRAFQEWLENDGQNCAHEALLMVDIDHFKNINDLHGHAIGDQIIIAMGHVCRDLLYPTTTLFRIGGDEFVVVFQCGSIDEMLATAQRLRNTFSTETRLIGEEGITATLSIGAALCPGTGISRTDLLARADNALYAAKQTGRDRVVHFAQEEEGSSLQSISDFSEPHL
ncbi:GGDEF domain-containing protein [Gluconobacter kondonii]|uniref:GGDEF domain-containing protein n=1 Tax=Gluconobacter kondonii TaxID=941463 RepID=UPI001B8D83BD|nr:GGDEF domain-containing protein [Gluconobacter kondonii]MBS1066674.1 GGDEF domain-containing protein [Gluconobacter kondonii]